MTDSQRASDELLLGMLREGRHDAEIAVRLGVTTGELRERKADIRNRLGPERYQALTGAGYRPQSSRRRRLTWAVGIGVGLFAIVLGVANLVESRQTAVPAALTGPAATATVPALVAPNPVTVDGTAFGDLGRVFLPASGGTAGLGTVEHRAALAVVPLTETVYFRSSGAVHWELTSNSLNDAYLRGDVLGRQLDVAIHAVGDARLRPVAAGVGPVLEIQDIAGYLGASVLIRVTQGGAPVAIRVTSDGHLLLADDPLPAATVLDSTTGAALDVSAARPFGTIPRTASTLVQNGCEPSDGSTTPALRCRVLWLRSNRGYVAPVDGTYACTGGRSVEFRGDGVRLAFFLRGEASSRFACQPTEIRAGDTLVPDGEWIIVALDATDRALSIVVALDGQVYVGEVRGSVSCPCLPS